MKYSDLSIYYMCLLNIVSVLTKNLVPNLPCPQFQIQHLTHQKNVRHHSPLTLAPSRQVQQFVAQSVRVLVLEYCHVPLPMLG